MLSKEISAVKPRCFEDFSSPLSTGLDCGRSGYGKDPDFPIDQRHEDANSLCFDTRILEERVEIMGSTTIELNLSCSAEVGTIAVRLCDVDPQSKSSSLVSYGVLNLTHRESHEKPEALEPGKLYRNFKISLNHIAHAFPVGHRIRIAVSTSLWPFIWPSAKHTAISLYTVSEDGNSTKEWSPDMVSRVILPVRPLPASEEIAQEEQPKIPGLYRDPRHADPAPSTEIRPAGLGTRRLYNDYVTGEKRFILSKDYGLYRDETNGMEHDEWVEETYSIVDPKHVTELADPLSARAEIHYVIEVGRSKEWAKKLVEQNRFKDADQQDVVSEDWRVRLESFTYVRSTATHFIIKTELSAYEFHGSGEEKLKQQVYGKKWQREIPRQLV